MGPERLTADAVELEQAKLRLIIVAAIELYLLAWFRWDGILDQGELFVLGAYLVLALLGVAHLGWALARPGVNPLRRRSGVLLDIGGVTVGVVLAGEAGVMLVGLYLWVPLGNGFRFGRWYLHYAQALALAGLALALLVSDYWQKHLVLGAAVALALVAIPWYASLMLARLQEARREAEAANTAKSKFLAAASHDLRQPMQALSMYAALLEERVREADALRVVHGIKLSVANLEQMFDGLLDISKIESGVITPNVIAFPLQPLVEHVLEAERPMAAHKNLDLRIVGTSASVKSDPALLERMLRNLVTNAIRYTDRGRIVVGCRRAAPGRLRLEVVDSGIGIALEEQQRIFDEYYQIDGKSAQGLGLGLPIVKSLGELLGHRVTVRSASGRGSVFSIELERAVEAAAAAGAGIAAAAQLEALNVVVVDDDVAIRESMRLLLESWGCRPVAGATVAEIEQRLRDARLTPDALIVDDQLAGAMSGLQVIERLRSVFRANLPALIITGAANPSLLQEHAGSIPFARKPVAPGKLRAFLSQARVAG